jgi:hypothetical protein
VKEKQYKEYRDAEKITTGKRRTQGERISKRILRSKKGE